MYGYPIQFNYKHTNKTHQKKTHSMNNTINVRQTRTVGDVLTDTFTYIRVYYKSLARMIAVYVLAPLMIGSLMFSVTMGQMFAGDMQDFAASQDSPFLGMGLELFGGFFFLMIAYLLLMGVIYQHIYYAGKGEVPDNISDFSDGMFSKLMRFIPFMILLYIIVIGVMILGIFSLVEISFLLLLIPLGAFLLIRLVLFPIAYFVEDAGGFNSLVRSWELTSGYFWQTFGVYLLITIVFGVLSQLLSTPLFLVTAIAGAGLGSESMILEVIVIFTYTLSFVFQVLFFAAQSIALGLQYFNLEERKEGHSLSKQVAGLEGDTA